MTLRVEQAPAAEADLIEHYRYIAEHDPDAAERFFAEIRRLQGLVADNPRMGVRRDCGRAGLLRMLPVPSFRNWLVYYREEPERLLVVRIIHAKRDLPTLFAE